MLTEIESFRTLARYASAAASAFPPVVALIAVQTLGALTAGYAWFVAFIAVETLAALMPPRRPALASAAGHMLGWYVSELSFVAIA